MARCPPRAKSHKAKTIDEPCVAPEYGAFEKAYDVFDRVFLDGSLPAVMITLQHRARSYGYIRVHKIVGSRHQGAAHELALNPGHFGADDDRSILSALLHEMVHIWQQEHGRPPQRA